MWAIAPKSIVHTGSPVSGRQSPPSRSGRSRATGGSVWSFRGGLLGVDLVMAASNPDLAFDAEGPLPSVFGGVEAGVSNNGRLTFPANLDPRSHDFH